MSKPSTQSQTSQADRQLWGHVLTTFANVLDSRLRKSLLEEASHLGLVDGNSQISLLPPPESLDPTKALAQLRQAAPDVGDNLMRSNPLDVALAVLKMYAADQQPPPKVQPLPAAVSD